LTGDPGATGRYLVDFETRGLPRHSTDVLVVGGGVAGLSAALAAHDAGADVLVLVKDAPRVCNTAWAQGGIAAAFDAEDSPAAHAADTLATGCGLCKEDVVAAVTEAGPAAVRALIARGARFDQADGGPALGREGGHSRRRVVHRGDQTGVEIERTLFDAVAAADRVAVQSRVFVIDLLTADGRCAGVLANRPDGELFVVFARTVILASGGAGRLFRETSNVRGATGDGLAAAYRAGATLRDLEFVQFHPTTLYLAGSERVLVTEAVRGEGARLIDNLGRRFLADRHPDGELAPRDVVSRALVEQLARDDVTGIYLDLTHWPPGRTRERFPGLAALCARYALEPERDPIPVRPAAHYCIGGVGSDLDGRTNVPGLLACGEASCSGLHGANRLASNSLLEGLVLGERAGRAAAAEPAERFEGELEYAGERTAPETQADVADLRKSLVSRMWRQAGVLRDAEGLEDTAEAIELWRRFTSRVRWSKRTAFELENLLLLGALVAGAARLRDESRGVHGRLDRPDRDDERLLGSFLWRTGAAPEFRPKETIGVG